MSLNTLLMMTMLHGRKLKKQVMAMMPMTIRVSKMQIWPWPMYLLQQLQCHAPRFQGVIASMKAMKAMPAMLRRR